MIFFSINTPNIDGISNIVLCIDLCGTMKQIRQNIYATHLCVLIANTRYALIVIDTRIFY